MSACSPGVTCPGLLESMDGLAVMYSVYTEPKRNDEAERLYVAALAGRKRTLGEDHPDTLKTMYHLSGVIASQGRPNEAVSMAAQVLQASMRIYSAPPQYYVSRTFYTYTSLGRYAEAEKMLLEVLEAQKNAEV